MVWGDLSSLTHFPVNYLNLRRTTLTKRHSYFSECDVGIVGGGISGLYMAFEILTDDDKTKVCIFEKDNVVGGRIRDHRFKEAPDIDVGNYVNFAYVSWLTLF